MKKIIILLASVLFLSNCKEKNEEKEGKIEAVKRNWIKKTEIVLEETESYPLFKLPSKIKWIDTVHFGFLYDRSGILVYNIKSGKQVRFITPDLNKEKIRKKANRDLPDSVKYYPGDQYPWGEVHFQAINITGKEIAWRCTLANSLLIDGEDQKFGWIPLIIITGLKGKVKKTYLTGWGEKEYVCSPGEGFYYNFNKDHFYSAAYLSGSKRNKKLDSIQVIQCELDGSKPFFSVYRNFRYPLLIMCPKDKKSILLRKRGVFAFPGVIRRAKNILYFSNGKEIYDLNSGGLFFQIKDKKNVYAYKYNSIEDFAFFKNNNDTYITILERPYSFKQQKKDFPFLGSRDSIFLVLYNLPEKKKVASTYIGKTKKTGGLFVNKNYVFYLNKRNKKVYLNKYYLK